ncbi:M23 family metallopeptidase [Desulfosporosinus sp. SYSU MS00001]|uniref:M23 family metallopeptidase n=1 Tax=Desulfosporosinus sp. SYSU MS00001 TaxID=3416284 RepID=UPI003CFA519A
MDCFQDEGRRRIALVTGSVAFFMGLSGLFLEASPVNAQASSDHIVCYSVFSLESKAEMKDLAERYQTTVSALTKQNPAESSGNCLSVTLKDNFKSTKKLSRGKDISYIWPTYGLVTSGYGPRDDGDFHHGLDIAASIGTPIKAAGSGEVIRTGWYGVYGLVVVVKHEDGVETLYGHNSKILVRTGDNVHKGETISLSGNTGNSTGPHLHFEIRMDGKAVNPKNFLP